MSSTPASEHRGYRFGRLFLDLERHSLFHDGTEIPLRPRSFQVLAYLLEHHGCLVTRDELMEAIWGRVTVTEGALTQCIVDIRRAIEDDNQQTIRTVPRQGYLFDAPVTLTVADTASSQGPAASAATSNRPRQRRRMTVALLLASAAIAAVSVWRLNDGGPDASAAADATHEKSLAVLPFADMSAESDQQYFADGLTEEILNLLARSPELKVIARSSSFSLRDRDDLDAVAIGRLLNVHHLLEGSIRRGTDRIRVTAQLIETAGGTHLWSESFDAEAENVLQVQSRIARSVAEAMAIALKIRTDGATRERVDPAAYDAYVRARHLHYRRSPGDLARAKELYQEATLLDPGFAAPWAGLAGLYSLELSEPPQSYDLSLELMGNAARTAMSLDPGLAEAHARLGSFHAITGAKELAAFHLDRAAELNPNSPLVLGFQAGRALEAGRYAEALERQRRLIALDPLNYIDRLNLVHFLLAAGHYDEAALQLSNAQALQSHDPRADFLRFRICLMQGRLEEAAAALDSLMPGEEELQARALLYGVSGDEALGDAALQALADIETPESAILLGEIHAYRGDHDEAVRWLGTSHRRVGPNPTRLTLIRWHREVRFSPFLQDLRHEPGARPYFVDDF